MPASDYKKKKKKKKKKHETRVRISMNQLVGRGNTQWGNGCITVLVASFTCSTS